MKNIINLFKPRLNIFFCLVFILLFMPVLNANEPTTKLTKQSVGCVERGEIQQSNPKSETCGEQSRTIQNPQLDKKEFAQKTMKLHMPFIANNGQVDGQVKFYAKTFGGTVFVTKEGEIVYALPNNSSGLRVQGSECRGELHSPNGISPLKRGTHPLIPSREGNGVCNKTPIPNDKNETHPLPLLIEGRTGVALREEFVGSKIKAIQGVQPSVTKVSYFKGNDPSKWKVNISTYDAVNLGEIYDGIELKLRAYGNNVEKLFCVKPGADPEQIKIRLNGLKDCGVQNAEITHPLVPSREGINPKSDASTSLSMTSFRAESRNQNKKLQINKSGELVAETELGLVRFTKPVAYQEISGKRVEVDVEYNISNPQSAIRNPKSEYGFKVASYDKSKPLIIDPLLASTYLGGADDNDGGYEIRLDTSGNVYVTGITSSTDFPTTSGAYDTSINNAFYYEDIFISKLNSGLTSLLASTYLGGSDDDGGFFLTLDTSGNVYMTGHTRSKDFPTTSGAYDTSYNSDDDVFISKLNSGLTKLLASTFLGGSDNEHGSSLALDTSGNVYVTGSTDSTNFPTTSGAYDTSFNGGKDVFISKVDSGLTSLLASTYLGGSYGDGGNSLALDTSGNVYVTGFTYSTDFPTTSRAYDTSFNSDYDLDDLYDVFVSKLDGDLTALLASTFLGGVLNESGYYLTLDTSGDVYVTGFTYSADFPTTSGAYDTSFNYDVDVFVSKLSSRLTSLLASTFLGGSDNEFGRSLVLDTSGHVYVTGNTDSEDFPTTSGAYDTSINNAEFYYEDIFISKLNSGLTSLLASTFLGGGGYEYGYSLVLDTSGNVYVTGDTESANFPTTSGAYDTSWNYEEDEGYYYGWDVFISKLDSDLSASTACIGIGDIGGWVTDAKTGKPIAGARVAYGIGTSRQDRTIIGETETNAVGNYEFLDVECGDYVVIADANGYKRSRRTNVAQVSVEDGTREQIYFELQPRRDSK